jgi:hypothetical protein
MDVWKKVAVGSIILWRGHTMKVMKALLCLTIGTVLLMGCNNPTPSGSAISQNTPAPDVFLQSETETELIQEFNINNCDGKAEASRTETRTSTVDVTISSELATQIGASAQVVSASVEAAVGAAFNIGNTRQTSIELKAPPNTHMYFQLAWVGQSRLGIVQNVYGSTIPVAFQSFSPTDVRIKSQVDLPCDNLISSRDSVVETPLPPATLQSPTAVSTPPQPTSAPDIAPTSPPPTATSAPTLVPTAVNTRVPTTQPVQTPQINCPLIVIEGSVGGLPIAQTKTWSELGGTTREPQSANLLQTCSRDSDNQVQVWVGYWSDDTNYLAFRGSMTPDQAISLVRQNENQPIIIVPWGE